jgi:hypothetical protein
MIRPYTFLKRNLVYWLYPGFAEKRTCRSLKSAWIGFRIARREAHLEKMDYCVEGTQKFEKQRGLTVSTSSDISRQFNNHTGNELIINVR